MLIGIIKEKGHAALAVIVPKIRVAMRRIVWKKIAN